LKGDVDVNGAPAPAGNNEGEVTRMTDSLVAQHFGSNKESLQCAENFFSSLKQVVLIVSLFFEDEILELC
jgi:hypothetical protein